MLSALPKFMSSIRVDRLSGRIVQKTGGVGGAVGCGARDTSYSREMHRRDCGVAGSRQGGRKDGVLSVSEVLESLVPT